MAFCTRTTRPVKILNINRVPTQPKKRKKITLVFDEEKRREFLGGFRKRKMERKKKAEEELQQQLKIERKRLKQEAKERMKKLLSNRDIPEIENLLQQKEYETEGHIISVLELNTAEVAEGQKWIGENKNINEEKEENISEISERDDKSNDEILGMSMTEKSEEVSESTVSNDKPIIPNKNFKRELKHAALKEVKKSKVFQQKQRIERNKNKKESRRKLNAKLSKQQSKKRTTKQKLNEYGGKSRKKGK